MQIEQVPAGDHTDVFSIVIQYGEVAEPHGGHYFGGLLHRGMECKGKQRASGHIVADRGGLAEHLAGDIGAVLGDNDDAAFFLGQHLHGAGYPAAGAHDDATCVHFQRGQLAFGPVADHHHITR